VFGIRDYESPNLHFIIGEQAKITHYMAKHTGGQYFSVPHSEYERALDAILMQLHFRYELGFIPSAIDGKRHELKVELTKEAKREHKGVRLRFHPEYIPVLEEPQNRKRSASPHGRFPRSTRDVPIYLRNGSAEIHSERRSGCV